MQQVQNKYIKIKKRLRKDLDLFTQEKENCGQIFDFMDSTISSAFTLGLHQWYRGIFIIQYQERLFFSAHESVFLI